MMAGQTDALRPLPGYAHAPIVPLSVGFLMLQPFSSDLYPMFVLGFGGAQLAVGALSHRYGRRPVLLRLPETNVHQNPKATEWSGPAANRRRVLGARAFWAHALPGALSVRLVASRLVHALP